jgi:hypothetical protein
MFDKVSDPALREELMQFHREVMSKIGATSPAQSQTRRFPSRTVSPFGAAPAASRVVVEGDSGMYFKDENGVNYGVKQVDNVPRVLTTPWLYDISEGLLPEVGRLYKFGTNSDVGTTPEVVGTQGGVLHYLTTEAKLNVASTSLNDFGAVRISGTATGGSHTTLIDTTKTFISSGVVVGDLVINDTDNSGGSVTSVDSETQLTVHHFHEGETDIMEAGDTYRIVYANSTGASVITVQGVDGDYQPVQEWIVMNRTADVPTTKNFLRAFRVEVHQAGTAGWNVGRITVKDVTNTYTITEAIATRGQSESCYWTVPCDHTFYLVQAEASELSGKGTIIRFYYRPRGHTFRLQYILNLNDSNQVIPFPIPLPLDGCSDIEVRAESILAGGNVACSFHGYYKYEER